MAEGDEAMGERASSGLTEVQAGPFTIRGISVGGVYTSLQVRELGVVLDAGVPIRGFAATDTIFLSHGHSDHASGLGSLLGIRGLIGKGAARVVLPAEIEGEVKTALAALSHLHRRALEIDAVPMRPGDEVELRRDLRVRAFRTHHPVPSLGYAFIRRVSKLRPEHHGLSRARIAELRARGEDLFDTVERAELAYATDTTSHVLTTAPILRESRVAILECTFLAHRSVEQARARAHIHLDELIERADELKNEVLVLMHFSQAYSPAEVHRIVRERCPPSLAERVVVFAPPAGRFFG